MNIIHGDVNKLDGVVDGLDNNYDAIFDFLSFDVKGLKYKLDYLATKCKQYFFVSSSVAYSFEDEVITENTKLGNEYWDYGSNKVKCEQFLRDNYKKYGIIFTIIRHILHMVKQEYLLELYQLMESIGLLQIEL